MLKSFSKNLPLVIIGFGSIGQRHYNNLKKMGYNNLAVYDPDNKVFKEFKKTIRLPALKQENLKNFKAAFICSPSGEHIGQALVCARAGLHLFIEKPLSHNLAQVKKLDDLCEQKKLISLVGCNMRFHPALAFIKAYLEGRRLGKIYGIFHEFGYYLPFWRPGKDYRKNYAAKKNAGGGIILDDIHEFDLLFWLNDFAEVKKADFIFNTSGALEIETEDNCLASFEFKNKVLGMVKCDYLQQAYSRKCKIVGELGNLEWDFKENIVWLKTKDENKKLLEIKNYDFNKTYIEELKYYFVKLNKQEKTFNDIKTAVQVLRYCAERKG